jgi:organic radical activating enzyme
MQYPVNDVFYSLKGEGRWTGYPMFFIRLSGCNLNCDFCDTDFEKHTMINEVELVKLALKHPTKRVVITGGEPLIHDLTKLLEALGAHGFSLHLESNATIVPLAHYRFNWIAMSPKNMKFLPEAVFKADEVKCLVGIKNWKTIANFASIHARRDAYRYVMPLAEGPKIIDKNTKEAIQFCLDNPNFGCCLQVHKILGIK